MTKGPPRLGDKEKDRKITSKLSALTAGWPNKQNISVLSYIIELIK